MAYDLIPLGRFTPKKGEIKAGQLDHLGLTKIGTITTVSRKAYRDELIEAGLARLPDTDTTNAPAPGAEDN